MQQSKTLPKNSTDTLCEIRSANRHRLGGLLTDAFKVEIVGQGVCRRRDVVEVDKRSLCAR